MERSPRQNRRWKYLKFHWCQRGRFEGIEKDIWSKEWGIMTELFERGKSNSQIGVAMSTPVTLMRHLRSYLQVLLHERETSLPLWLLVWTSFVWRPSGTSIEFIAIALWQSALGCEIRDMEMSLKRVFCLWMFHWVATTLYHVIDETITHYKVLLNTISIVLFAVLLFHKNYEDRMFGVVLIQRRWKQSEVSLSRDVSFLFYEWKGNALQGAA